jgi:hypothetical protein
MLFFNFLKNTDNCYAVIVNNFFGEGNDLL